ncbi:MAG: dockerin type I repeat-containing protein [Candidatus Zixiibacteriota bacterium]|nr:MAG: dockerin type I repeat-containing protein [candidate division Zixibacteria bacterium]
MKRGNLLAVFIFTLAVIWQAGIAGAQDCGDVDLDGGINLLDATFVINYLYKSGMPPVYPHLADVDSTGAINILDVSYLISYLYKDGPGPSCPDALDNPMGRVVDFTDCKLFTEGQSAVLTPNDSTCIEYSYDGEGTLQLRHVNAGFNCCPGQIVANISVEDNIITIVEAENYDSLGPCYCLCLFDVDMEILYLPPGQYTITVEELYLSPEDDPLEFTIDLSGAATGSHCVYRHSYPWGFDTFVSGEITDTSDCKTFPTAKPADLVTPDFDCMEYLYDGQNVLQFRHINAGFNCCPIIGALITVDSNVITITESETYDEYGPCLCLCLFDVDYEITGIGPGEYIVVVEELYLEPGDESLVFNIDLTATPSGSYCVERDHYPWGEVGGPSGGMTGHSDCMVMTFDKGTLDEDCIVYEYDGSGLLTLQHINDIFNCCVDSLYAAITFDPDSNIILIEEYEAASMPCDCICIYDLDYEIANLPPGEYTIRVDNVDYYDEYNGGIIEFTVDLVASPSGYYCVDRPYLPWMGK